MLQLEEVISLNNGLIQLMLKKSIKKRLTKVKNIFNKNLINYDLLNSQNRFYNHEFRSLKLSLTDS
jgi:hypothetical protein